MNIFFYFSLLTSLFYLSFLECCTGLRLSTKEGESVHGRTLEFGVKVDTSIVVIPRNYSFVSTTPLGNGLSYKSNYAILGTISYHDINVMDGMNEEGLSVSTFYFPGYASYSPTTPQNQDSSLSPVDFPNWILTQFKSLEEVKTGLKKVRIAPTIIKEWGETSPPFHYIVYDKSGNSLVIEPLNERLIFYDNPLGVFTNSPDFDWHLTFLRNFINLSPNNSPPLKVDGLILTPFGQGSGMVGMPGDFTPPSRFVRASIYSLTTTKPDSLEEAILQTFHLLNQFDIPIGVARDSKNGVVYSDYTLITVVHDPIRLHYYFKTYEDQTIKMVNLKAFNPNALDIKIINTMSQQSYVDISDKLKSMHLIQ
jgi:choloylglycine hydrolase